MRLYSSTLCEDAPLPILDSMNVGNTIEGFVAWHRSLVELRSLSKVSRAPTRKEPVDSRR